MEEKRVRAKKLVSKLGSVSESMRSEAICELRMISKQDPESRALIADAGAIPYISEFLYSPSSLCQENAAAALLNLSISDRESLMSTRGILDALSHALRNPTSPSAAQSVAATIYSLLLVENYRSIIGSKRDILYALVDILRPSPNSVSRTVKDALKALFGICLYPLNRASVIELGCVPALFSLILKDGRVGLVEDATAVIAQVAGCEEAPDAFGKVSGIEVLIDLLDMSTGSSPRTKENSVSALLNLAQCGGEKVVEHIKESGFWLFEGIQDVAQNGQTSSKGKSKAMALLKLLGAASSADKDATMIMKHHHQHHDHNNNNNNNSRWSRDSWTDYCSSSSS
ncbi:U-box domain-containing protein 11-like [Impatiens glandulifera]|uniref:U-box domain-containing protein 11-like n=1 Tax=Impatiens glandulifera TaxID=253017 RepID=UPI001FB13C3D|nr:U-box domain-containing protein 11-like [Impatiens glandulifera]